MANDSKDIELRIRARDYSQKTLDEVTKSLTEMAAAQKAQLDAAAKGETTAVALEKSYRKIEDALKAVAKQFATTQQFDQQTAALERARAAADKARQAQTQYANSLVGLEKITKAQANEQTKLAAAVRNSDKDFTRIENALARTVGKLEGYGIATDKVAAAQKTLSDSFKAGDEALQRQAKAIDDIEANIQGKIAADQAAAAAAKKAAAEQLAAEKSVADAAAKAADWQRRLLILQNQRDKAAQEQADAERAVSNALKMSAQQAEASAKGYQTLARSVKSVRGDELAKQLRAISDPSGVAVENLKGLEDTLTGLQSKVAGINGPFKDFRSTLASLDAAQRGAAGIAAQIDAYRRQIDVLRATRAEYAAARTAVADLATQMRAGGGNAAELNRQMSAAQATLARTAGAMSAQVTRTREMRTALRDAGVGTAKLGDAQKTLVTQANRATDTINKLRQAYQKFNVEGNKPFNLFGTDGGRTTLSYAQRIRGELLAMATAYVGLQAGVNLATGALQAYRDTQKINQQLGAIVGGDAKLIREEWDYLMATANRIGFEFQAAAPAYAKFAIAAKSFGFTADETRFVFEKFAEGARVAGQSSAEFEGILKSVEQMLSKGTIQAEELRGQLGDRLPGAFTIAAKAMGVTTAELTKMMELGEVSAENVINIARQMGEQYKGIDEASQSMAAAEARFNNASFQFKKAIADNGFADAYTKFITELTTLMQGDDGKRLAAGIGDAFTAIVDILRWVAQNIDLVVTGFKVLTGLAVVKWIVGVAIQAKNLLTILSGLRTALAGTAVVTAAGSAIAGVGTAATGAVGGLAAFRIALVALGAAVPWLTALSLAAWGAYEAYKALSGERSKAEGGSKKVTGRVLGEDGKPLYPEGQSGKTPDPGTGGSAEKRAMASFDKEAEKRQAKLDADRKAAQKKSAKEELAERQKLIKDEFDTYRVAAQKQIGDKAALGERLLVLDRQEKQALVTDKIRFDAENARSNSAAGNREVSLKQQIADQLLKIQNDLAAKETSLDATKSFEERKRTRIEAVASAYDKLKRSITALAATDKAGAADALAKLNSYVGQLQTIEGIKATTEEIKRLEDELSAAQSIRNAQLAEQQSLFEAGLIAQDKFLANSAEINTRGDSAIRTAAENLQAFVDAAVKANAGIMSLTGQADVKAKTTGAIAGASNTEGKNADAANEAQSTAIDNLVAKRTAAEAIFKQQFDLRMITEDEYAAKVNANAELYKQQITAQTNALLLQLETQRAQLLLEGGLNTTRLAALDAQIAKMTLLKDATNNAALAQDFMQQKMAGLLDGTLDTALSAAADSLAGLAQGTMSVGQAFESLGTTVASFFAKFLMQIAQAIAKQLILNALASMGGPIGGIAGQLGGVATKHSGGVIGRPGGVRRHGISPSLFVNAPRFHSGGFPGLKADEVPAILQKGEEVLSKNDDRNTMNGGGMPGGQQQNMAGTRFVLVDDRASVAEAMQSAQGENVIVQAIKRNSATVKALLK